MLAITLDCRTWQKNLISAPCHNHRPTMFDLYRHFYIEDESQGYRLIVGDYTGNATDRMGANNGQRFTTSDKDFDSSSGNCANSREGGWWYTNCGSALVNDGFLKYFSWGDPLIFSTMMVRPYA